jgi:putative inorganic carbon (hco3(-)) transporter
MNHAAKLGVRWIVLSLPLMLAVAFSSMFSPQFSALKNALFVFMVSVLLAFSLFTSFRCKPQQEMLTFWIAAAVNVALIFVSAIISQRLFICLPSVVLSVCGVLLFAVTLAVFAGEGSSRAIRLLQKTISIAAVVVALITVEQFFGLNLLSVFGVYSSDTGRMRMYSTLGNPDFVATLLAASLPASVGLSIAARRGRALCISVSVLIGVAVLLTGSRGGVVALAAGLTVFAFTAIRQRTWIMVAIVAACALTAGTQLNARTPWESLQGRIFIWQVSLEGGAAQSAFGSGPGTFAYDYPVRLGHFFSVPGRESLLRYAGLERHAENDFVEAWHDTGWLGIGSLMVLLGIWFMIAIRRLRQSEDVLRPFLSAAIASVSALCVASLFDFPMHRAETWALLWLCMAAPLISPMPVPVPQRRRKGLRLAGAVLLLVAGSFLAFAPLFASYELAQAASEENSGQLKQSQAAYRAALRWDPSSPDANFGLVRIVAKGGDYPGALDQSNIAKRYVNEPELYILRSRILQYAGRESEARRELESATRIFPFSTELSDEIASSFLPVKAAENR